jgi:uncharacterized membrane protein
MSATCSNCGIEITEAGSPCPVCGQDVSLVTALKVTDRFAAALAYFTFIPAIIFLLLARFKSNGFVRFHSFQSIFLAISFVVVAGVLRVFFVFFSFIPFLVAALIVTIAGLAYFAVWIVLLVKALQGMKLKLPWIGGLADRQAND